MKDSARYANIVEWSEEDQCYVGSAPGLIHGGCHGDDERAVFAELCQIVEEAVELYKRDNKPLPPSTAGQVLRPSNVRASTDSQTGMDHT
jgi:predicted RNase H-like HicB family nuclease